MRMQSKCSFGILNEWDDAKFEADKLMFSGLSLYILIKFSDSNATLQYVPVKNPCRLKDGWESYMDALKSTSRGT